MADESRTGVGTGTAAAGTKMIAVAVVVAAAAAAVIAALALTAAVSKGVVDIDAVPKIAMEIAPLVSTVCHRGLAGRAVEIPTNPSSRMASKTRMIHATEQPHERRRHSQLRHHDLTA